MFLSPEKLELIGQDSNYHDLGVLPSNGVPYKGRMTKLFIRPFQLSDFKLVSRAAQLNDISHLVRAVDNCISHPVNDLTFGDFYYILLWLRLYSVPDTPYVLNWDCDQPYFINKETRQALLYNESTIWPSMESLELDYEHSVCNTSNTSVVHKADIDIVSLDENLVLDQGFDFPRVSILSNMQQAIADPDFSYLASGIQWIDATAYEGPPVSDWEAKVALANKNPKLVFEGLEINKNVVHGISENVTFRCSKCQVKHHKTLALNALTFFQ